MDANVYTTMFNPDKRFNPDYTKPPQGGGFAIASVHRNTTPVSAKPVTDSAVPGSGEKQPLRNFG